MDAVLRRLLLVAALLFLPLTSWATTVTKIGECTAAFVTNCSITASSGVAQGHGVIIATFSAGSPTSTFTATDSASNTYQTDDHRGANSHTFYVLSAYMATAIGSGGTITITPSNGSNERWHMVAYDASSFASSAWKDQSATNSVPNGTSWPSGTTAATAHQPNINFVLYVAAISTTISYGGSGKKSPIPERNPRPPPLEPPTLRWQGSFLTKKGLAALRPVKISSR